MDEELMSKTIEKLKARAKITGMTITQQHEYLIGAMQMYLLLKPASENDGSWAPPSWVIGIMRGKDFTKEAV